MQQAPAKEPAVTRRSPTKVRHAHCPACQPSSGVVVAMCGSPKKIERPSPGNRIPPDACVVCVELWNKTCLQCGV